LLPPPPVPGPRYLPSPFFNPLRQGTICCWCFPFACCFFFWRIPPPQVFLFRESERFLPCYPPPSLLYKSFLVGAQSLSKITPNGFHFFPPLRCSPFKRGRTDDPLPQVSYGLGGGIGPSFLSDFFGPLRDLWFLFSLVRFFPSCRRLPFDVLHSPSPRVFSQSSFSTGFRTRVVSHHLLPGAFFFFAFQHRLKGFFCATFPPSVIPLPRDSRLAFRKQGKRLVFFPRGMGFLTQKEFFPRVFSKKLWPLGIPPPGCKPPRA